MKVVGGIDRSRSRGSGAWRAEVPVVGGFVDTSAAILSTAMKPGQLIALTSGSKPDVLAIVH